jgi:hypothetical protein
LGRLAQNIGLIVLLVVIGGVIAYYTNFGGIRNYFDTFFRRSEVEEYYENQSKDCAEKDGTFVDNMSNGFDINLIRLVNK